MTFLVFSVLPAPDSPVHRIDWSSRSEMQKNQCYFVVTLKDVFRDKIITRGQVISEEDAQAAEEISSAFYDFVQKSLVFFSNVTSTVVNIRK